LPGKRSGTKYRLLLHAAVPKELKKLPAKIRHRAKATIDGLADEPIPVGAGRLRGRENTYRIRIGNYRIVYEIHVTEVVVYVVGVAHRREVYRRILDRR
jgi:mRNA interferase RelE/StbE